MHTCFCIPTVHLDLPPWPSEGMAHTVALLLCGRVGPMWPWDVWVQLCGRPWLCMLRVSVGDSGL